MVQLVLNTLALDPNRWTPQKQPYYQLDTLLAKVAEAGFHHLELWQYHIAHEAEAEVRRLRSRAEALGVQIPIVGLYPRLHLDGDARQDAWDEAQRVLTYAAMLGAEIVKIFVGSKGTEALDEASYQRALAFLAELVEWAQTQGLTITGETHPDTLFDTLDACRTVLGVVNSNHFKACFQPFDFSDTAQAIADYEALHEHVIHVHFQGRRAGALTLLEDADLDYETFMGSLVSHGFAGYLCLELIKASVVDAPAQFNLDRVLAHARQDRAYIMQVAERCGMALTV